MITHDDLLNGVVVDGDAEKLICPNYGKGELRVVNVVSLRCQKAARSNGDFFNIILTTP